MNLNFKLPQNFNYEAMRRQAKVNSKERLKHNQLPFWRRDIFSPWSPPDSVPKIAQTLHLQHAARVNPRGTKFDHMTVLQFHHRCRIANRLLRRRHVEDAVAADDDEEETAWSRIVDSGEQFA